MCCATPTLCTGGQMYKEFLVLYQRSEVRANWNIENIILLLYSETTMLSLLKHKYLLFLSKLGIILHARPTPQYYEKLGKAWSIWWSNQTWFWMWLHTSPTCLQCRSAISAMLAQFKIYYCSKTAYLTPQEYDVKPGRHCKPPMVTHYHTPSLSSCWSP